MIRGLTGFMAASAKRSLRDILLPASPDTRFHRREKTRQVVDPGNFSALADARIAARFVPVTPVSVPGLQP